LNGILSWKNYVEDKKDISESEIPDVNQLTLNSLLLSNQTISGEKLLNELICPIIPLGDSMSGLF
jgi:hypothetical protein